MAKGDRPNEVALANTEAEHAVVGCLAIDPDFAGSYIRRLQPAVFNDPMARAVVRAFLERGATDPVAIATRAAETTGQSIERYLAYVNEQMASVPSAASVETYVALVQEAADRKQGVRLLSGGVARLLQGQRWDEVRLSLARQLGGPAVTEEGGGIKDVVAGVYAEIEAWHNQPLAEGEVRYLTTGLRTLNELTGGLQPALYLCGARPSTGKTALWLQVAVNAARALAQKHRGTGDGVPGQVLYFTNEMTSRQLTQRLVCSLASVSMYRLQLGRLTPEELHRTLVELGELEDLPLEITYTRTLSDIISRSYRTVSPPLIVIDYLNKLVGGRGENRNQELGDIAQTLFHIARDLQAPMVVLCQLNRDMTKRGRSALPEMEDLRDSGELEQTADVILLLHRYNDAPEELQVLKPKDRLGGGQHEAIVLTMNAYARITDRS